jgi:mono/diheme cytochrome c family protein
MNRKSNIIIALVILLFSMGAKAQAPWTVSSDEKAIQNPLTIDATVIEKGADLFVTNCSSCHGPAGENKALAALKPTPPDLGNVDFLKTLTGGEIFTKMSNGRGSMPSFKASMSEQDRWTIISYLLDLAGMNKTGQAEAGNDVKAFSGSGLQLKLTTDDATNKVTANLQGKNEKDEIKPAEGIKLQFFVKGYFGNLLIGESTTNENGFAAATVPTDLPHSFNDSTLTIIAQVKDSKKYGEVAQNVIVKWGAANTHVNLLAHRSMWTVRSMAPLWLIISYASVLSGVWIFIGYVILLIFKMRKAGME